MGWFSLLVPIFLLASAGRMLLWPQSFVGTGRLEATDPRTVRLFGWFFLLLGIAGLGMAATSLVKG
jgi:hypothetical protein